ncbi:MAG TPA: phosphopantetheine-binding protein [Longimicrobiales bacterium]|nr:phosphopantetheine-binding protein [Longimicrobiales bacterium]
MSTVSATSMRDATAIRNMIVQVLSVPAESVHPDADLVNELGAESIDFLDLLFQLDDVVGERVLPEHWNAWLRACARERGAPPVITPRMLGEFVVYCRTALDVSSRTGENS